MTKTSSHRRARARAALKRAVHRSTADALGIKLPPIGDPVPLSVKKLAAIELQRRQVQAAIPALAKLGGELFHEAEAAPTATEYEDLIARSREAWRLSRVLRRCTQSLVTTYRRADQQLIVRHPESCKSKLCPHCARTKSLRRWHELTAAVRAIKASDPDAKFILVTLTKPKSTDATLAPSLRRLSTNVTRLLAKPQIKRIVRGYFAAFEINYVDGEYHDHCHLLIHVPTRYGRDQLDLWVPQAEFVRLWSGLYATSQKLVVDVRFVRASDDEQLAKSFAELCKYLTAPLSLYKQHPDQPDLWTCHARPLLTLAAATDGVRLMRCGGTLAKARRATKTTGTNTTANAPADISTQEDAP